MKGASFEHSRLVKELRLKAHSYPEIDYVAPARLTKLTRQPTYTDGESGTEIPFHADQIVAADGRRSGTRRLLGFADGSVGISLLQPK